MFNVDTVAFDMDGTLLDSSELAVHAVQGALKELAAENAELPVAEPATIVAALGNPSDQFYSGFLPEWAHDDYLLRFRRRAFELECEILEAGQGKLFDGVIETLGQLKANGFNLVLVSNCGEGYLGAVTRAFELGRFFDQMRCIGADGGKHKNEILAESLQTLGCRKALMVGDRIHDMEAARVNDCHFAAALYGFGQADELAGCDVELNDVRMLQKLVQRLE